MKGICAKTPDFDPLLKSKNKRYSSVLSLHCKLTQKLQGNASILYITMGWDGMWWGGFVVGWGGIVG